MSWTRGLLAALAVCVLLLVGTASCGTGEASEQKGDGGSAAPVGTLLDETDEAGRHYREVDRDGAPGVRVEVAPDTAGRWDVRLTVRNFRFSPPGTKAVPVAGRGLAYVFVDGTLITRLRTPGYRLAARLVPHGTHHVTARLYADDDTAWAVHGKPIESTADITASGAEEEVALSGSPAVNASGGALALAPAARTDCPGRGSCRLRAWGTGSFSHRSRAVSPRSLRP